MGCSKAVKLPYHHENDILGISKLLKVLEDAPNTDFLDWDALFHETLVAMSENKALMQVWRTFVPVIRELFMLNFFHSQLIKDISGKAFAYSKNAD